LTVLAGVLLFDALIFAVEHTFGGNTPYKWSWPRRSACSAA